ncbi:alpha/beta hydrolase [Alsobacter sp. SYSU M60028]|uniref:Alpha/beta hydrolase n=1 Tax=Alsobacter ponti TaxID=2962936 RepID=A0ABT1LAB6_9HYPH|nr:alpha/beta hydrolase [Alsobacter ponti]MCP8938440.1 alpha/beta hydrolase [Alsobacter ponti]
MITDWTAAYANSPHIPGAAAYPERWERAARTFREANAARAELDIPYGEEPRLRADLFLPHGAPRGLAVFVHGGYWMSFDKSSWSHLAAGALAHGWAVGLPQYELAPAARISDITRQVGRAIEMLAERVSGPIRLAGHSAGGHLASRMACIGAPLAPPVQSRIAHVLSISGLHDLRPLMRAELNRTLRLDAEEARAESPALLEPVEGIDVTAWVGELERPEFVRQNDLLANVWTGLGARTRAVRDTGRHHFDVIAGLADPDSPICRSFSGPNEGDASA